MQGATGNSVHFEHYFVLLKGFCPSVKGMMAFAHDHSIVWQDASVCLDLKQVETPLKVFRDSGDDAALIPLDDGPGLELLNLYDDHGEVSLTLCLGIDVAQDRRRTFHRLHLVAPQTQFFLVFPSHDKLKRPSFLFWPY